MIIFHEKTDALTIASRKIEQETINITYEIFVVLTKLDHLLFKANGYKTIFDGKIDAEFVSETECRLGKWYLSGVGKEKFGKAASYAKLAGPHKEVHDNIQKAIECVKNGTCTQEAENVKTYFENAQKASKSVMKILDDLLIEEKTYRVGKN
ncbi:MAG: CZB domain-containing protein [Sulfurimonas sp.]|nr:CZB domain-containing protein [Sulfurimonas sp.]